MNFSTPQAVGSVIESCKDAEFQRGKNRALILNLFNGMPPFTEQEAQENGITVNIDWREGTNLAWAGRRQFENAFLKPKNFFNVTLDAGPTTKRMSWSKLITKAINRPLKRSRKYLQLHRSKWASVVIHGTGPQYWSDDYHWCPKFVPVEDLMIPTDTTCDLENLVYFAIRREYTVGELYRMTHGSSVDPAWNVKKVDEILQNKFKENTSDLSYNYLDSPEKWSELYKQNLSYWQSDKAPSVVMWDFYHMEDEDVKDEGWYRKMILDENGPTTTDAEFLYNTKDRVFAKSLDRLLHIQFGDGNNKPPFTYHSVRSLGFLLYDVCMMNNILRCKGMEHTFQNLMPLYRVNDPADRDRAKLIRLASSQIVEPGVEIIPQDQRHQVDPVLLQMMLNQNRQLMGESAATYTQSADTGTNKEQTATETMAKIQQLNSLMSSMLNMAYRQEQWAYEEICRRFCLEKAKGDKDVEEFRKTCLEGGIDPQYLDTKYWIIEPEQVLGGGNKMLELGQVDRLMAVRNLHNPEAQMEILHRYDEAVTDDPNLAEVLAPTEMAPHVTDAVHDAELSFGTMMNGIKVTPKPGINQIEQVETLLKMAGAVVDRINQTNQMGTPQEVIGLSTVSACIKERIALIAQDPNEKQRVKVYGDLVGEIDNQIKAFAQRQAQAAQEENNQPDPETMAKVQEKQLDGAVKRQEKQLAGKQKRQERAIDFVEEQKRKNAATAADIQRQNAQSAAKIRQGNIETAGSLFQQGVETAATAKMESEMAEEGPVE